MAVIAHLRISADSFELGQIIELEANERVELENMVPMGEKAVPFFSVSDDVGKSFEEHIRNHPAVDNIVEVTRHETERLYSIDWNVSRDVFFQGIIDLQGQLLSGTGTTETWEFEVRFLTHEKLGEFQNHCLNAHVPLEVGRIYNPVRPGTSMWYGVTGPQREALMCAVEGGYYSIPRQMSTQELADELGISDQATTERLRRAIETLTRNTLITLQEDIDEEFEHPPKT